MLLAELHEVFQPLMKAFQRLVEAVVTVWKAIRQYLSFLRKHGTRAQRRFAWKLLHPARRRRMHTRSLYAKSKRRVLRRAGLRSLVWGEKELNKRLAL